MKKTNGTISEAWVQEIEKGTRGETAWQKAERIRLEESKGYSHPQHKKNDIAKNGNAALDAELDAMMGASNVKALPLVKANGQPVTAEPEPEIQPLKIDFWQKENEIQPRDWLIPNWLPANEITIFAGRGGVGKSRMTLQIAQKVASGWPGYQWEQAHTRPALKPVDYLQHGQKVVVASWEDDINEMSDRMHQNQKALEFAPFDETRGQIALVNMRGAGAGPIWTNDLEPLGERLLKTAEDFGASLLVLDPSAAAYGGNEIDRAVVRQFMTYLDNWAENNKCTILILQHPPKYTGASYSGSTDWEASARAMWKIEPVKDEEGIFYMSVTKSNYLKEWPQEIYLEQLGMAWVESDYEPPKKATVEDMETQIFDLLDGKEKGLSTSEIKGYITGDDNKKIAALGDLVDRGRLVAEVLKKRGNPTIYKTA